MGWVHGFGVRRVLGISGAALAVVLPGALVAATPASALAPTVARTADAGSGTSQLNGTIVAPGGAKGPAGVTVSLKAVPASGDAVTRTVVSKADGTFTFPDLAGGDWVYTISVPYEGTTFSSDPVSVTAGQTASVKVPVFSSTEDAAKVTTTSWIIWLDETGDRLAVEQDLSYNNAGTKAYTGKAAVTGATPGAKAAVLLPLAPGSANYQYLGRFEVCCSAIEDTSWVHIRPINPGGSSGTLRYDSPRPASLVFTAQFRTDDLTVLVPQGTTISSPQLTAKGTSTDRNVTYTVYKSGALKGGDTITVTLGGAAAATSGTSPWLWVALGLLALVVVAALVWFLRRRRGAKAAALPAAVAPKGAKVTKPKAAPKPQPAKEAKPAAKPAAAAAAATTAPRTQAETLAEQLAQLDLKFENGELTDEAAYRRVRESLVQQLVDAVATDPTSLS